MSIKQLSLKIAKYRPESEFPPPEIDRLLNLPQLSDVWAKYFGVETSLFEEWQRLNRIYQHSLPREPEKLPEMVGRLREELRNILAGLGTVEDYPHLASLLVELRELVDENLTFDPGEPELSETEEVGEQVDFLATRLSQLLGTLGLSAITPELAKELPTYRELFKATENLSERISRLEQYTFPVTPEPPHL